MKPEGITAYPWKLVGRKRKIWSSRWRKKDGFGTKWAANEGQTPWFVRPHRRPIFALWPRRTSCFNEFANNRENFYIYILLCLSSFNSLPSFNFSLSLVVPRFHFLLIPLLLVTFPSLNGATSFPFGFPWNSSTSFFGTVNTWYLGSPCIPNLLIMFRMRVITGGQACGRN